MEPRGYCSGNRTLVQMIRDKDNDPSAKQLTNSDYLKWITFEVRYRCALESRPPKKAPTVQRKGQSRARIKTYKPLFPKSSIVIPFEGNSDTFCAQRPAAVLDQQRLRQQQLRTAPQQQRPATQSLRAPLAIYWPCGLIRENSD